MPNFIEIGPVVWIFIPDIHAQTHTHSHTHTHTQTHTHIDFYILDISMEFKLMYTLRIALLCDPLIQQHALSNVSHCWNTKIALELETSVGEDCKHFIVLIFYGLSRFWTGAITKRVKIDCTLSADYYNIN